MLYRSQEQLLAYAQKNESVFWDTYNFSQVDYRARFLKH